MSIISKNPQEKVRDLLKDQALNDSIIEDIMSQGLSLTTSLRLEIKSESGSNCQLNNDDIYKVLSFYGEINDFKILNATAFVTYRDLASAYFAQKTLNNKSLDFIKSTMIVV